MHIVPQIFPRWLCWRTDQERQEILTTSTLRLGREASLNDWRLTLRSPCEAIAPMNIPLLPAVREQMARDLANIAKDMLHGERVRTMTLRNGSWHRKVAARFTGIDDEDGMPVATTEVLRHLREDLYEPFAVVKLRYNVNGHITKSPGKKAFSEIVFDPPASRGFELARALTKWVDDWVPVHQHCLLMGNGDAFAGAKRAERAKDRFVRTSTVVDLRQFGFPGSGPFMGRLMLSPILAPPSTIDEAFSLDRSFSLHRTMPDAPTAAEALRQVEEELVIGVTVAWEKSGQHFTAFDVVLGDDPAYREAPSSLLRGLIHAMVTASKNIKGMPNSFRSPIDYDVIGNGLGRQRALWEEIGL